MAVLGHEELLSSGTSCTEGTQFGAVGIFVDLATARVSGGRGGSSRGRSRSSFGSGGRDAARLLAVLGHEEFFTGGPSCAEGFQSGAVSILVNLASARFRSGSGRSSGRGSGGSARGTGSSSRLSGRGGSGARRLDGSRSGGGGKGGVRIAVGDGEIGFARGLEQGAAADLLFGGVAALVQVGGEADRHGTAVTEPVAATSVLGTSTDSVCATGLLAEARSPRPGLSVDAAEFARGKTSGGRRGSGTGHLRGGLGERGGSACCGQRVALGLEGVSSRGTGSTGGRDRGVSRGGNSSGSFPRGSRSSARGTAGSLLGLFFGGRGGLTGSRGASRSISRSIVSSRGSSRSVHAAGFLTVL